MNSSRKYLATFWISNNATNGIEGLYVRQRASIIRKIGDVFLDAARSFRYAYPTCVGNLPLAEKIWKPMESSGCFSRFLFTKTRDRHLGNSIGMCETVCGISAPGCEAPAEPALGAPSEIPSPEGYYEGNDRW